MGKKFLKMLLIATFLIFLVLSFKSYLNNKSPIVEDIKLKAKLSREIQLKIKQNNLNIKLRDVTDFKWDKVVFITPYMDYKRFLKGKGLEYRKINTHIETNDDICLLIFYDKKEKLVTYINYKREDGDFTFNKTKEYSQESGEFTIIKSENGWIILKEN